MPARYQKLLIPVLLTAVWVVFSEGFSVLTLTVGLFFAICSLALLHQLRHEQETLPTIILRPFWLILFFLYLIGQIYLSGIQMIGRIISGRLESEIIEIETELDSDLMISVLSASITLTPGTVTVSRRGRTLTILRAASRQKQLASLDRQVKKSLEMLLMHQQMKMPLRKR